MRIEHKAIIEKAKKEGLLPMQMAAELLIHDMVLATREEMCRHEVGFRKLTEKQQDTVLNSLQDKYKAIAEIAARVIASGGTPTVPMTLKDLKIANGTLTGIVDGGEAHFNELISKVQDKSSVLIVLYPREFDAGLNAIQPDKDQKELPLDKPSKAKPGSKKSEPKPVELTEGLIGQAVEFVTSQQNGTLAGIQNQFKIDNAKGRALLAKLGELGLVGEPDERGDCKVIIQPKATAEHKAEDPVPAKHHAHDLETDDDGLTLFCDELVKRATAKVREDGKVSRGALCITFDLDDAVAQQVIDQLKVDGVVDADEQVIAEQDDSSQME